MQATRKATPLLGLTTLAVLGLAAVPAAHAQTIKLTNTDNVTVSGSGTHGTLSGAAVDNATSSYTGPTTSPAVDNDYAVFTKDAAVFTLDSGGTLFAPADNGIALNVDGSGGLTVNGGSATATGQSGDGIGNFGSGTVTVNGGTLTGGQDGAGLFALGSGAVTINGGTFSGGAGGYGLVEFHGAGITGGTFTTGAGGYDLDCDSSIDLYGDFIGLTVGQTEAITDHRGSFDGTLENNTVGQMFTYVNYGTITLHDVDVAPAPEPSQFAGLGLGVLGLAGLALRARKRRTA